MEDCMPQQVQVQLAETVKEYYQIHAQIKELDETDKALNKQIKTTMSDNDLTDFTEGDINVKLTTQRRSNTNSEMLVEKLKSLGYTNCIKTIEVPNENEIENLIYNGKLPADLLTSCTTTTEVRVLKIKKLKKKD